MKTIGEHIAEIEQHVQTVSQEREAELIAAAGKNSARALRKLLTKRGHGSLSTVLPTRLKVSEFAAATNEHNVELAARRCDQCLRCPEYGGECDSPMERLEPGLGPIWHPDGGFVFGRCSRWDPYLYRKLAAQYGVPRAMLGKTIQGYEPSTDSARMARTLCASYVKKFSLDGTQRKNSISLVGSTGVGKTHLASAILQDLLVTQQISSALFAYVPKFLEDVRSSFDAPRDQREEFMAKAINVDLLVLDDLGAERVTDWVRERVGVILNERWANARPIVITSNEDIDTYESLFGQRALSRLDAMCLTVAIDAEDRR